MGEEPREGCHQQWAYWSSRSGNGVMTIVSLPASAFPPLALGFFGLATGYIIYGPQELFGFPKKEAQVNLATGVWGIWMPGFLQFLTGTYLFVGLAWFHTFTAGPLYMAALAFSAYGVDCSRSATTGCAAPTRDPTATWRSPSASYPCWG